MYIQPQWLATNAIIQRPTRSAGNNRQPFRLVAASREFVVRLKTVNTKRYYTGR